MARVIQKRPRTAGFRFSKVDAVAIVIVIGLAVFGFGSLGFLTLIPFVVLGHFFLFCNIFRVRRNYELVWALVFILNFAVWFVLYPGELAIGSRLIWLLICQTPFTVILIGLEMRSANYHGIFARKINSQLDQYLAGEDLPPENSSH